jgi:hypothetical protein
VVELSSAIRRAQERVTGYSGDNVVAHREQHGNREAKKPKKDKLKGAVPAQSTKWALSEIVEAQTDNKH